MKALRSFEAPGTIHLTTQHHDSSATPQWERQSNLAESENISNRCD